jgi:hypothetical protein
MVTRCFITVVTLMVLGMAGSGCHGRHGATGKTMEQKPKEKQSDEKAVKTSGLFTGDDWIEYGVGNASFRGRTTVRIEANGGAQVVYERGTVRDEYPGTLTPDEISALQQALSEADPRALTSQQEMGSPDEARIRISWNIGGTESHVEFWDNEQWEIAALRQWIERFNAIAKTVSGGKVTH